jgi:NAD kinase
MPNLDWDHEPSSCALFFADGVMDFDDEIAELRQFLTSFGLRIEMNEYVSADFIVALGTDRFLLQVSRLFQERETPPILCLTPKGSGFMSSIEFAEYRFVIPQVFRGNCFLLPRCRLQIEYHTLSGIESFCVLNELAVNRDPLNLSLVLNCGSNGLVFSQLIGDGVIIATATGSTAYNKAAGRALVHPLLPVFMLTPLCPLSLSARPIVFPQSAEISISIGETPGRPRSDRALLGFDGLVHRELRFGEKLVIAVSPFSVNCVVMTRSTSEWLVRLAGLLSWNQRKHQKELDAAVAVSPPKDDGA